MEDLQRTEIVDILESLDSDVFSLRKLDDILDSIDNFESALIVDGRNVSRMKPAVFVDRLLGLDLVEVITWHNGFSSRE